MNEEYKNCTVCGEPLSADRRCVNLADITLQNEEGEATRFCDDTVLHAECVQMYIDGKFISFKFDAAELDNNPRGSLEDMAPDLKELTSSIQDAVSEMELNNIGFSAVQTGDICVFVLEMIPQDDSISTSMCHLIYTPGPTYSMLYMHDGQRIEAHLKIRKARDVAETFVETLIGLNEEQD